MSTGITSSVLAYERLRDKFESFLLQNGKRLNRMQRDAVDVLFAAIAQDTMAPTFLFAEGFPFRELDRMHDRFRAASALSGFLLHRRLKRRANSWPVQWQVVTRALNMALPGFEEWQDFIVEPLSGKTTLFGLLDACFPPQFVEVPKNRPRWISFLGLFDEKEYRRVDNRNDHD